MKHKKRLICGIQQKQKLDAICIITSLTIADACLCVCDGLNEGISRKNNYHGKADIKMSRKRRAASSISLPLEISKTNSYELST